MDPKVENNILNVKGMTEHLKRAFELFEEGKKGLQLLPERKKLTLFLGLTGTGKSTYAQLVFTEAENVIATEAADGDSIIEDGDVKIGNSLINSKTISPDFYTKVLGSEIITACDFGGFGDTRNMSHDLAVNCLIKTVADCADSVKMIFFTSHSSVRKGGDRGESFMKLLKHITDFVKDINKFRNGIALIVTQVENTTKKKGGQYVLVDDKAVTHAIADFLIQVKQELKENLKNNVSNDENYKEDAINIINILLTKNNERFSKIKLFRRPDECGPLNTSTLCQDAMRSFHEIFTSHDYVEKDSDDFRYGLSEKSINVVNEIVEEINHIISKYFKTIAHIVQVYFQSIQKNIYETIVSIMAGKTNAKDHRTEAKELASEFRNAIFVIGKLVDKIKAVTDTEKAVRIIRENISHLKVSIPTKIITDLINQVKYLDFLQTVCKRKFSVGPYDGIFNNILLFFQDLNKQLQTLIDRSISETEVHFKTTLEDLASAIEKEYTKRMKTLGPESVLSFLNKEKLTFSTMIETISSVAGTKERIEVFCNIESDLIISFPEDSLDRISKLKERLLYFEHLSNKDISIDLPHCILTLQAVLKLIEENESFYTFLKDLLDKFSKYKIQKVKHIYNVKNVGDWGSSKAEKGIFINSENYKLFLDKVSSLLIAECSSVKNLQFSESRQQELNHILSLTLKSEIKIDCTDTSVTIHGDYISLKSLFNNEHNARFNVGDDLTMGDDNLITILRNKKIKTVRFFAFHTIFIDQDLDFVGRKLSLMFISPKWEVIGTRKIDLSGKVGDEPPFGYTVTSAPHKTANDGVPGKPGGPGGNFYGIGETFENGENLTIFANGGKGGAGQKGQNGRKGEDAVITCLNDAFGRFSSLPSWVERTLDIFGKLRRRSVPLVSRELTTREEEEAIEIALEVGQAENGGNKAANTFYNHGTEDDGAVATKFLKPNTIDRSAIPFESALGGHGATNEFVSNHGEPEDDGTGDTGGGQSGKKWMQDKLSKVRFIASRAIPFLSKEVTTKVEEEPFQRNQIVLEVGKEGENGGSGGKGGRGGSPGKILILEPSGHGVPVVFVNNHGEPGSDGVGGTGGQSGKNKVLCGSEREGIIVELVEGGLPGEDGFDGSNSNNQEDPESAPIFTFVMSELNVFTYLMTDRFRKHHLKKFMKFLNTNYLQVFFHKG